MKRIILFLSFFMAISFNASTKNVDNTVNDKPKPCEIQKIENMVACQHEYSVTSVGCDGFRSTQLMGSGTGDCGSSPQNSVIRHNTDVNVCDEAARDALLISVAVAIITRFL